MSARVATAYPWRTLETVTKAGARRAAQAARHVRSALDVASLASALAELSGTETSLVVRRVSNAAPRRRPQAEIGFELVTSGVVCALSLEAELVADVLSRVLRRPFGLTSPAALDDVLAGAFS